MADSNQAPIIIKKVKKGGDGHHGGAWKVAYADFVTAMMAFFLLLWLLSSASDEQRKGIAEYFTPASVSLSQGGSNGVLGGQSIITEGAMVTDIKPVGISSPDPGSPQLDQDDGDDRQDGGIPQEQRPSDKALADAIAEREAKEFAEAKKKLRQALEKAPELKELAENMRVDMTPEGLRIQLVDQHGSSMFESGRTALLPQARKLHTLIAQVIEEMPNNISIRGHTDATRYRGNGAYSNWDLSADRANASRRALLANDLDPARIADVVGKADREPINTGDPSAPENRRISIVLLRDAISPSAAAPERAGTTSNSAPPAAAERDYGAPERRTGRPARAVAPFRPIDSYSR